MIILIIVIISVMIYRDMNFLVSPISNGWMVLSEIQAIDSSNIESTNTSD